LIDSIGYATYAQGNGGADTFIYNTGYSALEINESSGSLPTTAILQFGSGISASDVGCDRTMSQEIVMNRFLTWDGICSRDRTKRQRSYDVDG
jgi:hypothetical protein